MPRKTDKTCKYPNCPNVISGDKKIPYCPTHEPLMLKSWDMTRETATARGYTHRWTKNRNMKLRNDPLCEMCERHGITKVADLVHHVDGNSRNNRADNLMSLCTNCHAKIHSGSSP
jgi:5-methylcytosine-specific restriction enzyme A